MTMLIGINPDALDVFFDAILLAVARRNPQEQSVETFHQEVETALQDLPTDHLPAANRERLDALVALLKARVERPK